MALRAVITSQHRLYSSLLAPVPGMSVAQLASFIVYTSVHDEMTYAIPTIYQIKLRFVLRRHPHN
jgi:hypothetical protein